MRSLKRIDKKILLHNHILIAIIYPHMAGDQSFSGEVPRSLLNTAVVKIIV